MHTFVHLIILYFYCILPGHFRAVYQVQHRRAFGSSEVTLSENKEGSRTRPGVDVKKEGGKSEQAEKREALPTEGAANAGSEEQKHEEIHFKAATRQSADENRCESSQPETNDETEAASELKSAPNPERLETTERKKEVKMGKEGLLELLGAMKVDMTTKRRSKSLKKAPDEQETPAKPMRAELESASSMFQQAKSWQRRENKPGESLSPELVAAVTAAASTLPDRTRAESELLKQLRKHEAVPDERRRSETQNIGNIIADMKVGRKPGSRLNGRPANQIRFDDDGRGYTHDRGITGELAGIRRRKTAFSAKRLNIFSAVTDQDAAPEPAPGPSLWDTETANQLVQVVNQRPRNGFEEMIQWTREGKLWEYPINNQAGLEEEAKVPFHEHVFLQRHLEDGFPQQGPVRHFMELVVTGLSKNHQLTVSQKLEHIAWFRDYFHQKQEVLREAQA